MDRTIGRASSQQETDLCLLTPFWNGITFIIQYKLCILLIQVRHLRYAAKGQSTSTKMIGE